jgi:hypothetical protein
MPYPVEKKAVFESKSVYAAYKVFLFLRLLAVFCSSSRFIKTGIGNKTGYTSILLLL